MAAFQKSNWTRTVGPDKMLQYFPAAIPASSIAANSTSVITLTAAFAFKGNGPVELTLPLTTGSSPLQSGLSLGETILLSPAAGSYAAGNHPRLQFKVINSTIGALTPTATDLVAVQF